MHGEGEGFDAFFHEMFPKLARYAQRKVDADTAEEIAADTLRKVWSRGFPAAQDQDDGTLRQLRSYAFGVADGLVRNARRAKNSRGRLELALEEQARTAVPSNDDRDNTDGGLPPWAASLSLTDREILELLVDGYRVAEIAEILDCTSAAVSMRLQRARRNILLLWERGHRS